MLVNGFILGLANEPNKESTEANLSIINSPFFRTKKTLLEGLKPISRLNFAGKVTCPLAVTVEINICNTYYKT